MYGDSKRLFTYNCFIIKLDILIMVKVLEKGENMKKVIVIGAGILGASTAYHLAKFGYQVTIIDRKDIGQATEAAAGMICPWVSQRRNKAWYTLARKGAAFYPNLIQELEKEGERNTGYKRVGALCLHIEEHKLNQMEERTILRKKEAPEIGEILRKNKEETLDHCPILSDEYFSLYVSGAARVNGKAVRDALLNAAKKYGATVIYDSASLEKNNNQLVVRINNEEMAADAYIVTAGAWASELLSPIGIDLQIRGQKAQIVHLQINRSDTDQWPVVLPPNNQYLLPFEDGKIVIGTTYEDEHEFESRASVKGIYEILDKAMSMAPELANAQFMDAKVGYRPVAPNFLPIMGRVPGYENLYVANGLGSSGLTVGPFLGKELAKLVIDKPLEIDLDLYRVDQAINIK
jgi:D-amino-acid dehydrogenase